MNHSIKRLMGLALLGVIGWYLWRNHFSKLGQKYDIHEAKLKEVATKQKIGDTKRTVHLAHQVPIATVGETPFSGLVLTAFKVAEQTAGKAFQLLPKGNSQNPYDRTLPPEAWS